MTPVSTDNPTTAPEAGKSTGKEIDVQTYNANEQHQDAGTSSDGPGEITKIVPPSDNVSHFT